jgi:hypothetical protein
LSALAGALVHAGELALSFATMLRQRMLLAA